MAQYVFFMILSLGLYFATPISSDTHTTKKVKKSLRILKNDGGSGTWGDGDK